jgi:hypothetical protein
LQKSPVWAWSLQGRDFALKSLMISPEKVDILFLYNDYMNDYKIILLGSQCSGKSTLNSYLKKTTNLNSIDHDKEISQRNGGSYPRDHNYVVDEVMPAIEADIL